MKSLILAAGRGTRLGALTEGRPKPMLPIGGVPMVERIMAGIASQAGIRDFVLVTGYRADVIEDYFGDGACRGWSVTYVHQDEALGVGHAVHCARPALAGGRFLMTYGDIMLAPANYGGIVGAGDAAAIVGLNWVDDPYRGAAVYLNDDQTIGRIQEKPPRGTAATHWNNAGLFVFDPIIFEYTARLAPSPRGEYELPDAVSAMIRAGHPVRGYILQGAWRDVGTPEDYAAINGEYGTACGPAPGD